MSNIKNLLLGHDKEKNKRLAYLKFHNLEYTTINGVLYIDTKEVDHNHIVNLINIKTLENENTK